LQSIKPGKNDAKVRMMRNMHGRLVLAAWFCLGILGLHACGDSAPDGGVSGSHAIDLPLVHTVSNSGAGLSMFDTDTDTPERRLQNIVDAFSVHNQTGLNAQAVWSNSDTALVVLHIDNALFKPGLVAAPHPQQGVTSNDAAKPGATTVVVGSSFVSASNALKPVGLLRLSDRTLNPLQIHGYTRILGLREQMLAVVDHKAYERDMFESALQLGPGIVEAGALDISERDLKRPRYFRAFVALCRTKTLVGTSTIPMHLRTLGQAILKHASDEDLTCDEVINLAGDRETLLGITSEHATTLFGHNHARVSLLRFRSDIR
jgi:hypothetical protein